MNETPETPKRRTGKFVPAIKAEEEAKLIGSDPALALSLTDTQPTAGSPITEQDYRDHMQGWQAGVSGHQPDEKSTHQYRIGFERGRAGRTEYARALKVRVVK